MTRSRRCGDVARSFGEHAVSFVVVVGGGGGGRGGSWLLLIVDC